MICNKVKEDGQTDATTEGIVVYTCSYLAITTGHHAKPSWPKFKGEESFSGAVSTICLFTYYNSSLVNNTLVVDLL